MCFMNLTGNVFLAALDFPPHNPFTIHSPASPCLMWPLVLYSLCIEEKLKRKEQKKKKKKLK